VERQPNHRTSTQHTSNSPGGKRRGPCITREQAEAAERDWEQREWREFASAFATFEPLPAVNALDGDEDELSDWQLRGIEDEGWIEWREEDDCGEPPDAEASAQQPDRPRRRLAVGFVSSADRHSPK
jgi:hypothetical protein